MAYVGLHHHTTYSFLEAIGVVKDHVARVADVGLSAMAITDYNGIYGAIDLYKSVKDYAIKPIIGADMPWTMDLSQGEPRSVGYVTFLARNVA
jgi:DNA polymerase III alpha subunit